MGHMYDPFYKISKFGKFNLFARTIICAVLRFAHLIVHEKWYCTNLNTQRVILDPDLSEGVLCNHPCPWSVCPWSVHWSII